MVHNTFNRPASAGRHAELCNLQYCRHHWVLSCLGKATGPETQHAQSRHKKYGSMLLPCECHVQAATFGPCSRWLLRLQAASSRSLRSKPTQASPAASSSSSQRLLPSVLRLPASSELSSARCDALGLASRTRDSTSEALRSAMDSSSACQSCWSGCLRRCWPPGTDQSKCMLGGYPVSSMEPAALHVPLSCRGQQGVALA